MQPLVEVQDIIWRRCACLKCAKFANICRSYSMSVLQASNHAKPLRAACESHITELANKLVHMAGWNTGVQAAIDLLNQGPNTYVKNTLEPLNPNKTQFVVMYVCMYRLTTLPRPCGHWQLQELLGNHIRQCLRARIRHFQLLWRLTHRSRASVSQASNHAKPLRAAYEGHITELANKLVHVAGKNAGVQAALDLNQVWNTYVKNTLEPRNRVQDSELWEAGRPPTNNTQNSSDADEDERVILRNNFVDITDDSSLVRFHPTNPPPCGRSQAGNDHENCMKCLLLYFALTICFHVATSAALWSDLTNTLLSTDSLDES